MRDLACWLLGRFVSQCLDDFRIKESFAPVQQEVGGLHAEHRGQAVTWPRPWLDVEVICESSTGPSGLLHLFAVLDYVLAVDIGRVYAGAAIDPVLEAAIGIDHVFAQSTVQLILVVAAA